MGMVTSNFIKEAPIYLLRYSRRKIRRFNLIPRTEKIIDQIPRIVRSPPKFDSTLKEINRMNTEMPDSFEKLHKKNEELLKNLEKVYVRSEGSNKEISKKSQVSTDIVRRFYEPSQLRVFEKIPDGKYTHLRANQFLCAHAKNPEVFTPEVLSLIYKIDEKAMRNILTHVKVLTVIVPENMRKKSLLQDLAESMVPPDFTLSEPHAYEKRKLIAASTLFDKRYNKNKDLPQNTQEDKEIATQLSLLHHAEQVINQFRRKNRYVRVKKKEERVGMEEVSYHESFMMTPGKERIVKPEDDSLDKLIEDAIRRSDENERKLQEEEKRKAQNLSRKTVFSQSKITQQSDEQIDEKDDSVSDSELDCLSKSIPSGGVVKRDNVSSTGYYSVEDKRLKKKEKN